MIAAALRGVRERQRRTGGPDASRGFTLLEVLVAIVVLAVIVVPLSTALIQLLRGTSSVSNRLGNSGDAETIAAAWQKDVHSLDPNGPNNVGACQGLTTNNTGIGTPLITFTWDQAPVGAGQPAQEPKSATWTVVGLGRDAKLVRRYCERELTISEQTLASHFGVDGVTATDLIHAPDAPGSLQFCTTTSCTLKVDGSFQYQITAARRVTGTGAAVLVPPPPPTITGVAARNRAISVAWNPPALPQGVPPVTGYRVEAWTNATLSGTLAAFKDLDAQSRAADLTGLTNGTNYWVVVYAINTVGSSLPSNVFGPVQPHPTVPSIPLNVRAGPGGVNATPIGHVDWVAPADDGGSPIDSYTIIGQTLTGVAVPPVTVGGSVRGVDINNLAPGTAYSFQVFAHNSLGNGPTSDPALGNTRPPAPTGVTATSGDQKVLVSFTLAGNGDVSLATSNAIRVTATCVTPSSACTNQVYLFDHPSPSSPNRSVGPLDTGSVQPFAPLSNGQSYDITVEVSNIDGYWGPASSAFRLSPKSAPVAPTVVSIASTGVSQSLAFNVVAPFDSGSSVSSYQVTRANTTQTLIVNSTGSSTSFVWDQTTMPVALTDYALTGFTVKACNAIGCSPASATFTAMPGAAPVATGVSVTRNTSLPRGLVVAVTGAAGTGTPSVTTWAVTCAGPTTGSVTGLSGSVQVSNIPVGISSCSGTPSNNLPATSGGVAGTVTITGSAVVSNEIAVFDSPPPLKAILALPADQSLNDRVLVTPDPYPTPSGGTDPGVTYVAVCGNQPAVISTSAPLTVMGLTPGTTVTCTVAAENSAGYRSTSPPASIFMGRTAPSAPAAVSIGSNGLSKSLAFSIGAPYNGGAPLTSYKITPTASPANVVTLTPAGATTTFTWNGSTATYALTDFVSSGFTLQACNALGCSAQTPVFNATPGVAPAANQPTVVNTANTPRSLTVGVSTTAGTGSGLTSWVVACNGAPSTGSYTGTSGSVVIANVPVSITSCNAKPTNTLAAVSNGSVSSVVLAGTTRNTADVAVFDAPGKMTATLSLPPYDPANPNAPVTSVIVNGTPYPTSTGSPISNDSLTYFASCNGGPLTTSASLPITVPGLTAGSTVSCSVGAANSAYQSSSDPVTVKLTRTVPAIPTNVSAASTGASKSVGLSIPAQFDGGYPITSYKIRANANPSAGVSVNATGTTTTFTWDAVTVPAVPLTNFSSTNFSVAACNQAGCSGFSSAFAATPGPTPVTSQATAVTGNPRPARGVVVSVTATAVTSNATATSWAVSCAGPTTGSIVGVTGSLTLTGVPTGLNSCAVTPSNTLGATVNGQPSTIVLTGAVTTIANVDVYDVPGALDAPTMSLPPTGTLNHVYVTTNPPSVPSGGGDPGLTYQAICGSQSSDPTVGGSSPTGAAVTVDVTGFTPGSEISCYVRAVNSAGYQSVSPSSVITLVR